MRAAKIGRKPGARFTARNAVHEVVLHSGAMARLCDFHSPILAQSDVILIVRYSKQALGFSLLAFRGASCSSPLHSCQEAKGRYPRVLPRKKKGGVDTPPAGFADGCGSDYSM